MAISWGKIIGGTSRVGVGGKVTMANLGERGSDVVVIETVDRQLYQHPHDHALSLR